MKMLQGRAGGRGVKGATADRQRLPKAFVWWRDPGPQEQSSWADPSPDRWAGRSLAYQKHSRRGQDLPDLQGRSQSPQNLGHMGTSEVPCQDNWPRTGLLRSSLDTKIYRLCFSNQVTHPLWASKKSSCQKRIGKGCTHFFIASVHISHAQTLHLSNSISRNLA